MDHRHTLRFLFVRGLTTVLFVGGLALEDQENCLRQFPLLMHVISFRCDRAQKEIHRSKPRTPNEKQQSIPGSFFRCSSLLLKEKIRACVFQVAEACKTLKSMLKHDTKWKCTDFKMMQEL
jgi:hypothetical protein